MNAVHRDEDMTLAELRAIINETSRDLTVALIRIIEILDIRAALDDTPPAPA